MKIKDSEEIFKEIWERYNKNPDSGWNIWLKEGSTKDRKDLYISDGNDSWFLALFINLPRNYGKGIKFKGKPIQEKVPLSSGIRPLSEEDVQKFMNLASKEAYMRNKKEKGKAIKQKERMIKKIINRSSISLNELQRKRFPLFIFGPFYTEEPKSLDDISKKQRRLKEKLALEVNRMRDQQTRYIG